MTTTDDTAVQPVEGTVGEMLVSLAAITAEDLPKGVVQALGDVAQVIDDPSLDSFLGFRALNMHERRDVAGLAIIALPLTGTGVTGIRRQVEAYRAGTLTMSGGTDRESVAVALSRLAEVVELLTGEDPADMSDG